MGEMVDPDDSAPPGTGIGHVHLRVADLNRSIAFYRDVLGLILRARLADEPAFLGHRCLTSLRGVVTVLLGTPRGNPEAAAHHRQPALLASPAR